MESNLKNTCFLSFVRFDVLLRGGISFFWLRLCRAVPFVVKNRMFHGKRSKTDRAKSL